MDSDKTTVTPAPVLQFPTMYNGKKKPVTTVAPKLIKDISIKAAIKPVVIVTPEEQRANNMKDPQEFYNWAINVNGKQDMRLLSRYERLALLEGPSINLVCAGKVVGTMPLRLAVATSKVAREAFIKLNNKDGKAMGELGVSHPNVGGAVKRLGNYLVKVMRVHTRPFFLPSATIAEDIDILLVSNAMGMGLYTENLGRYRWAVLKYETLPTIGFYTVEALDCRINEYTDQFPILRMFVQRWGGIGYYRNEDDTPIIAEWRKKLPSLHAAVQRFLAERKALREADTTAKKKSND